MSASLRPATLAAQALGWVDDATRGLSPSIHPATTYERDPDNAYRSGRIYTRADNPTFLQPEALLCALERGSAALLFSSGMAAVTATFQSLAPGDHVIAQDVMYWGVRQWLQTHGSRWGLDVELVPAGDLAALKRSLRPGRTRLVWVETPANPTWVVTDIAAAAELAHAAGARLVVDSTAATPVLTRPLELGADLVMHSATKYLNGHSDVLAGALVAVRRDEFWERLVALRHDAGAVPGPFEAWLLLRGMRTLFLRVAASCRGAQQVAEALQGEGGVLEVLYPGLREHPGHAVAARQMRGGFGGMLSLRVRGGAAAAVAVAARVRVWKRATSLGGTESLIEHRASIEGAGTPVPDDLLRLSVGIEDPEDLVTDLREALAGATAGPELAPAAADLAAAGKRAGRQSALERERG